MKTIIVLILVLTIFVIPIVYADWTASKNANFFQRMQYVAERMQVLRNECVSLEEWWFAESVSVDLLFVNVDGITTSEVTAMITYCQSLGAFHNNQAVATSDRKVVLAPFLANIN